MGSVRLRGLVALALCGGLIFGDVAVAKSRKFKARVAATYVAQKQEADGSVPGFSEVGSTADAVVSWAAARSSSDAVEDALDRLEDAVADGEAETIGLKAKVVLAAAAGGRDPENFGGRNLVADIIASEQPDGRFGVGTPVFDQALALLALQGSGNQFSTQSVVWLAEAQCRDGGWQFDEPAGPDDNRHCENDQLEEDFFTSDTNTTSLVVQVLAYIEESPPEPAVSPFKFFRKSRDGRFDGWGYTPGFNTDSNSTALVLQAYAAEGLEPPTGARRALQRLQYSPCSGNKRAGAFAFTWVDEDEDGRFQRSGPDVGATIGGIQGLLEIPIWDVKPASKSVDVACAVAN